MSSDVESDSDNSEFDLDTPEAENGFDMAALLEPLIPPSSNIPVAQLLSVSL